jgi:hypothetical protein
MYFPRTNLYEILVTRGGCKIAILQPLLLKKHVSQPLGEKTQEPAQKQPGFAAPLNTHNRNAL